jgi:hypothetical protein
MTPSYVLNYVKTKLGLPYVPLELIDDQIISWIKMETIQAFSRYVPFSKTQTLNTADPKVRTSKQTDFYLVDDEGLSILDVQRLYSNEGNMIIMGQPILGVMSSSDRELSSFLSQTEMFGNSWKYSQFRYWFNFLQPNIIRIMPRSLLGVFVVEYECFHKPDFSTIPAQYQQMFLNLAWCDTTLLVSRIRKQFPEIQTPFGPVSLNGIDLSSEAKEDRDKIMEELSMANPSILVQTG